MLSMPIYSWSLAQNDSRCVAHHRSQGWLYNFSLDKAPLDLWLLTRLLFVTFQLLCWFFNDPFVLRIRAYRLILHWYDFGIHRSFYIRDCFVHETALPELVLLFFLNFLKCLKNLQLLSVTQELSLVSIHRLNADPFVLIILIIDRKFAYYFMHLVYRVTLLKVNWGSHL